MRSWIMQLVCIMLVFVLVGPDSFCVVSFVNSIGIKYLKKKYEIIFCPKSNGQQKTVHCCIMLGIAHRWILFIVTSWCSFKCLSGFCGKPLILYLPFQKFHDTLSCITLPVVFSAEWQNILFLSGYISITLHIATRL